MGTLESAERDVALGLTARGFPWQRRRRILRDRGFRRPQDASKPTQHLVHRRRDDCGYADLGCTGQTDYRTPALDRLATEGIRFTQAYANSALCTNTRFALLAGRYQYRLPIGLVEPLRWSDRHAPEMGVPPGFPTLPSLLRGTGYRTAFIGKWHLGYLPRYSPLKSGYDEFFGVMGGIYGLLHSRRRRR